MISPRSSLPVNRREIYGDDSAHSFQERIGLTFSLSEDLENTSAYHHEEQIEANFGQSPAKRMSAEACHSCSITYKT